MDKKNSFGLNPRDEAYLRKEAGYAVPEADPKRDPSEIFFEGDHVFSGALCTGRQPVRGCDGGGSSDYGKGIGTGRTGTPIGENSIDTAFPLPARVTLRESEQRKESAVNTKGRLMNTATSYDIRKDMEVALTVLAFHCPDIYGIDTRTWQRKLRQWSKECVVDDLPTDRCMYLSTVLSFTEGKVKEFLSGNGG